MNYRLPLVLLSLAAALPAQDHGAPPSPKTAAHDALRPFVGTWKIQASMSAMPGVEGMEQAGEWTGVERIELVCDGLWLKATSTSNFNGKNVHGIWMLGHDPFEETYKCVAVSSMEPGATTFDATRDAESGTWHFTGETSMGLVRTEFVMKDADHGVEICYTDNEDGEEVECMRIERTRLTGQAAKAAEAAASKTTSTEAVAKLPAPLAALHDDLGTWNAAFKMEMPGQPAMTAPCHEVVEPACGGAWTWSTFTGNMMGAPFTGHALTGYDAESDTVISFWIDSMTSPFMRTDGEFDAETKTFTQKGESYGPTGEVGPVTSTSTTEDKNTRQLRMEFGEGAGKSVLTIDYTRAKKE